MNTAAFYESTKQPTTAASAASPTDNTIEAQILVDALDVLQMRILIIDQDLNILSTNLAGRAILDRHDCLTARPSSPLSNARPQEMHCSMPLRVRLCAAILAR